MALSSSTTRDDIVNAVQTQLGVTLNADAKALWLAIIDALYIRIKADISISSTVASGIPVSTTGTAAAQTGSTTATGTASSSSVT